MRGRPRFVIMLVLASTARSQTPSTTPDKELATHLQSLQRKADDQSLAVTLREPIAMEMASTLDRAAQASATPEARRDRWGEAVNVLDTFNQKNPGHPLARPFEVQSAVYVWAVARMDLDRVRANPNDAKVRASASDRFSESVRRLRGVVNALEPKDKDVFAQNARYRLAMSLADLAEAKGNDYPAFVALSREALAPLNEPVSEPSLRGYAHLLRATLLTRTDRLDDAQRELDEAAKATPPPPAADLLEAKVALLVGQRRFDQLAKAIDDSKVEPDAKPLIKVRALLAERSGAGDAAIRSAAESTLFHDLKTLQDGNKPEARAALIAAAGAIKEPESKQKPFAWDLIAAGAVLLGDPGRAGRVEAKGAEVADSANDPQLAADYRLKAGAFFFQAGRFADADPILTRVAEDPKLGLVRAKAGLLRALARGRAVAKGAAGASQSKYVEALQYQVKTFPDDPSTAEARWLLGKVRLAANDRDAAEALWRAIPARSSRWLDSRLDIARLHQAEIDNQRLNGDDSAVRKRAEDARSFLNQATAEAHDDHERLELLIATARLELTPGFNRPDLAIKALDQVKRSPGSTGQHETARRLYIVALAESGRFVESEQAARGEAKTASPADLMETIRLLDRAAAETESDLKMRRMGLVLRILLTRVGQGLDTLTADDRAEIPLRNVRALLFSGDDDGAKRSLEKWTDAPPSNTNEQLRDVGETYNRLGAFRLAEDVQRLRARRSPTGSLSWFDARYGLALAYYRSGKPKEAVRLIDATAILHPDLGGGQLRDKFIKLRQRIGDDQ